MLFSRIVEPPRRLSPEIASTAIGIEALTVRPARRPRYTVDAPKMSPNRTPITIALAVNSAGDCDGETYGWNAVFGGDVSDVRDVCGRVAIWPGILAFATIAPCLVKTPNKGSARPKTDKQVADQVSELTTNRLSVYLRSLNVLEDAGVRTISSQALAEQFHLNAAQIR